MKSTDLKSRVIGIKSLVVWVGEKSDTTDQETIVANKELIGIYTRCLKISKCITQIKPLTHVVKLVMKEWQVASLWFEKCFKSSLAILVNDIIYQHSTPLFRWQ